MLPLLHQVFVLMEWGGKVTGWDGGGIVYLPWGGSPNLTWSKNSIVSSSGLIAW